MVSARRRAPAFLLLAASALTLGGCSRRDEPVAPPPAAAAPPAPPPAAPRPPAPIGRAELLQAAAQAAEAYAGRGPYPATLAALGGRPFRLRLPFGCFGPSEKAPLAYSYDEAGGVLRLAARPEVWTGAPLGALGAEGQPAEAVEGFWIRRPWLTLDSCPPRPAATPGVPPAPETVALVQVFGPGDSRLRRRNGQAYELTRKAELDPAWLAGFRFVLEGRIAEAGGRPVRCRSDHPDQRPVCLIRVEIDRAAFETASGEVLGDWRN